MFLFGKRSTLAATVMFGVLLPFSFVAGSPGRLADPTRRAAPVHQDAIDRDPHADLARRAPARADPGSDRPS
jgi:hypothetical protein